MLELEGAPAVQSSGAGRKAWFYRTVVSCVKWAPSCVIARSLLAIMEACPTLPPLRLFRARSERHLRRRQDREYRCWVPSNNPSLHEPHRLSDGHRNPLLAQPFCTDTRNKRHACEIRPRGLEPTLHPRKRRTRITASGRDSLVGLGARARGLQGSGICTPRWAACIVMWGRRQPIARQTASPASATCLRTPLLRPDPRPLTRRTSPSSPMPLHGPPPSSSRGCQMIHQAALTHCRS